jgi:hypothetical protein
MTCTDTSRKDADDGVLPNSSTAARKSVAARIREVARGVDMAAMIAS